MKKISILILLAITCINANAQDEKSFSVLDTKTVLKRLFDNATFNEKNEALWKPNYSEKINFPVSDDKFCHTVVDTIMYYSAYNLENAVIVFATYEYANGEITSCHACAPIIGIATFSREKGKDWVIEKFVKNFVNFGSYGSVNGSFAVKKFSDNLYCLELISGIDGGQGYFIGVDDYYALNSYGQFTSVFSYPYSETKGDPMGMTDGKVYTEETTMKLIPGTNYPTIELSIKRDDTGAITKKEYIYDVEEERYIPAK